MRAWAIIGVRWQTLDLLQSFWLRRRCRIYVEDSFRNTSASDIRLRIWWKRTQKDKTAKTYSRSRHKLNYHLTRTTANTVMSKVFLQEKLAITTPTVRSTISQLEITCDSFAVVHASCCRYPIKFLLCQEPKGFKKKYRSPHANFLNSKQYCFLGYRFYTEETHEQVTRLGHPEIRHDVVSRNEVVTWV